MGATYYQGVGIVFSPPTRPLSPQALRYFCRHVQRQTGILLSEQQARRLWVDAGCPLVLGEPGEVRVDACVRIVDVLCTKLLGHEWPIKGGEGVQPSDEFFHNFTSAAIKAGFEAVVPRPPEALLAGS